MVTVWTEVMDNWTDMGAKIRCASCDQTFMAMSIAEDAWGLRRCPWCRASHIYNDYLGPINSGVLMVAEEEQVE